MKDKIQKLIKEITTKDKNEFNSLRIQIQNGRWKLDKYSDDKIRQIVNPRVRARDKGKCCFCGGDVYKVGEEVGGGNTIHHIFPVRYGGKHEDGNLITICAYCHQRLEKYINVVERAAIKNTLIFVGDKLKELNSQ